jgi:predicted nucleic acid-binding protein
MKAIFADTSFYIALFNSRDKNHQKAKQFAAEYEGDVLTSAWIVIELANNLCRTSNRSLFVTLYHEISDDPRVTIIPLSSRLHEEGISLYIERPDKDWSLTDCISFLIMHEHDIKEAATTDHHFEQAGFVRLIH